MSANVQITSCTSHACIFVGVAPVLQNNVQVAKLVWSVVKDMVTFSNVCSEAIRTEVGLTPPGDLQLSGCETITKQSFFKLITSVLMCCAGDEIKD